MDISRLRPMGPWVLLKLEPPQEKTSGGMYLPQGNLLERLGSSVGVVVRKGPGKYNTGKKATRAKYEPMDLEVGDRVVFRGYLQELNKPGGYLDPHHCLLHIDDITGVIGAGTELTPALPYDN